YRGLHGRRHGLDHQSRRLGGPGAGHVLHVGGAGIRHAFRDPRSRSPTLPRKRPLPAQASMAPGAALAVLERGVSGLCDCHPAGLGKWLAGCDRSGADRGCGPALVLLLDRPGPVSGHSGAHPVVGPASPARVGDCCRGCLVHPDPVQLAVATGRSEPRCTRIGLDLVDSLPGRLLDGWGAARGPAPALGSGPGRTGGDRADGAADVAVAVPGWLHEWFPAILFCLTVAVLSCLVVLLGQAVFRPDGVLRALTRPRVRRYADPVGRATLGIFAVHFLVLVVGTTTGVLGRPE